jgi:hypothetical protein
MRSSLLFCRGPRGAFGTALSSSLGPFATPVNGGLLGRVRDRLGNDALQRGNFPRDDGSLSLGPFASPVDGGLLRRVRDWLADDTLQRGNFPRLTHLLLLGSH